MPGGGKWLPSKSVGARDNLKALRGEQGQGASHVQGRSDQQDVLDAARLEQRGAEGGVFARGVAQYA